MDTKVQRAIRALRYRLRIDKPVIPPNRAQLGEIAENFDEPEVVYKKTGEISEDEEEPILALADEDSIRRNVALILITFSGLQPPTKEVVQAEFAKTYDFFESLSYGATYLTGEVFGPFSVTRGTGCDWRSWHTQAKQKLAATGVDLTKFTNFAVIGPRSTDCTFAGIAAVGGNYIYMNGTASWSTLSHELGHNFGLWHARLRRADGSETEYGDVFDRMGSGLVEFNAAFRHRMGVLDAGDMREVETTSTVVIGAAEYEEGTPKLIRVRRPDGTYLALETRRNDGIYSPKLDSHVTKGVLIREVSALNNKSTLLDTRGTTTSEAALLVGEIWTDPLSGVKIEAKAVEPTFSTVKITVPGTPDEVHPMIVFIANGEGFIDGLCAATGAAATGGRVLLTRATALPAETLNALNTLKPTQIVIVGGTAVVSQAIEDRLKTIAPTSRVGGANRYETAALVALRK